MLSLGHKESILRRNGVAIPHFPVRSVLRGRLFDELQTIHHEQRQGEDLDLAIAVTRWQADIEQLYDIHIRRPVESAIDMIKGNAKSGLIPKSRA